MHRLFSLPWIHSPCILDPCGAPNTPDHPAAHPPCFFLWFFLHNKQCSPNFCVVFSTAISIYTNFLTPKQPLDRMPNQIRTSHLAKIHLTTHRIFRSQDALGVNTSCWQGLSCNNEGLRVGIIDQDFGIVEPTLHRYYFYGWKYSAWSHILRSSTFKENLHTTCLAPLFRINMVHVLYK